MSDPDPDPDPDPEPERYVDVDETLVRTLLETQRPELASAELTFVGAGWDNVLYRLEAEDTDLLARLPRRQSAAQLLMNEQRWLVELAPRLPLPIPVPVWKGRPSDGYPWPWSLVSWIDGDTAAVAPFDDAGVEAIRLGRFLAKLHQPAPADAPVNPFRGVALNQRTELFERGLGRLAPDIDPSPLTDRWNELRITPGWSGAPCWLHGDLHAANLLVCGGVLAAVIDWGDLTAGDPATDLAVGWMLFEAAERQLFFRAATAELQGAFGAGGLAGDEAAQLWSRAEAWALIFSVVYVASEADHPVMGALGRRLLARLGF